MPFIFALQDAMASDRLVLHKTLSLCTIRDTEYEVFPVGGPVLAIMASGLHEKAREGLNPQPAASLHPNQFSYCLSVILIRYYVARIPSWGEQPFLSP